jgi:pimeloyl-ACP methyl ester carboxylesterase
VRDAEEKAMKKLAVSLGRVLFILLLLAGLSVCTMSDQSESSPPEDALSFDQLLANLDELQGPATQSPSAPGKSVFSLPDGSLFSSADLSTYLNAIKRDLAAYIYSCTGGRPYLVVARTLTWDADPNKEGIQSESGLMWVPITWWGKWISTPIVSYQHGTQVYRECAPSKFNANPLAILVNPDLTGSLQNYVECVVGALMATAGYTVVMPDYTGFGSSLAIHPYVHLSLGDSVVGALAEAQRKLASRGVRPANALYLTGYSEGGYTTMAGARALQIAGIPVTGIVPCDGPYDLTGAMLPVMIDDVKDKVSSYVLYTASGYKAYYKEDIVYSTFLESTYATLLTTNNPFNGWHTNAYVDSLHLPASAGDMVQGTLEYPPDTLKPGGTVFGFLADNNAWKGWLPQCPLAFVHCPDDDVVPYQNAVNAYDYYLATYGVKVPIFDVQAIPFIESVMGSKHIAAYPSAMLTAFHLIRGDY